MAYRRTLKRDVGCTGIGLHTGRLTRLRLRPAAAEHGVRFRRVDVGVEIPAAIENLAHLDHATTLQHNGVTVSTVEHLLSA
jgi:UDP-3-O-[3-hydroxymyristoyl] N-acetylglucosamine deacetylase